MNYCLSLVAVLLCCIASENVVRAQSQPSDKSKQNLAADGDKIIEYSEPGVVTAQCVVRFEFQPAAWSFFDKDFERFAENLFLSQAASSGGDSNVSASLQPFFPPGASKPGQLLAILKVRVSLPDQVAKQASPMSRLLSEHLDR